MIDIRQPNITAKTETEQLLQMRSYLYQLSQQLQWAFSTIRTEVRTDSTTAASVQGNKQVSDPAKTFAELKNLIIKSADIVDAYYSEINGRLEKIYVAQSDFGTYKEQAGLDIRQNADGVSQLFDNYREISTSVGTISNNQTVISENVSNLTNDQKALSDTVSGLGEGQKALENTVGGISETLDTVYSQILQTEAYIRTGLLNEDGNGHPVYGLEIGQTNTVDGQTVFDKFARFSADRLSFFDSNDTEVAYISDYKLYITNAEITGALVIAGRFKIYYSGGLAFQWIGGEV